MVYDILVALIKKHFFVTSVEKLQNEAGTVILERYVAKHPLLKPELIVVNDQIHGFKKTSKRISSLEKFPIYLELETIVDEALDHPIIDHVDLYVEANIKSQSMLSDMVYLANIYSKSIAMDRVIKINDPNEESLMIYSKINELIGDQFLEEDIVDGLLKETDIGVMLEMHLVSFINFIKILDDMIKGKKVTKLEHIFKTNPT